MPAPSGYPRWASSPSSPGDIVEPSSGVKDDGFNVSERPPAQWFNWLFNLIYLWIKWFDEEIFVSGSRTIRVSPWVSAGTASPGVSPAFKAQVFSIGLTQGYNKVSNVDSAMDFLPVSDLVPDGVEVTNVIALVKPGSARTGTNKMGLIDRLHVTNWASPASSFVTSGTTVYDDGTTNVQKITLPMGIVVDRAAGQLVAQLICGNDSGTNEDRVLGWEIQYTGRKWR